MKKKRELEVGAAELDVLRVLWDEGPLTVRPVMNALHRRGRQVAYTTVQTLLTRLEQKGLVASDKADLAHVFRARVTRDRVRRHRVKTLVKDLYDGAPAELALHLIRSERLRPADIVELHKLIESLDAKGKASNK
ncbi:MAG: BlaI/MecI/CopY family transcriptional regulator [Phycisphaerae bacterium]